MSTGKTDHFQLHSWEATDNFLRSEFNENFQKIDEKIFERGTIAAGVYVGNGAGEQTILTGFTPAAVLVIPESLVGDSAKSGLAADGYPAISVVGPGKGEVVAIIEGGFKVFCVSSAAQTRKTNAYNEVFRFIAVA